MSLSQRQSVRDVRFGSEKPAMSTFPITDVGRRIRVSIWLSVYEYTP